MCALLEVTSDVILESAFLDQLTEELRKTLDEKHCGVVGSLQSQMLRFSETRCWRHCYL